MDDIADLFKELSMGLGGLALIAAVYLIPSIVGWKKKDVNGIIALNLFLGWTVLGWVAALVWAFSSPAKLICQENVLTGVPCLAGVPSEIAKMHIYFANERPSI